MDVCSRPSPWELHGKGVGSHAFIVDRAWLQDGLSTDSVSGSGAMRLGVAGFGASPSTAEDAKSGRTPNMGGRTAPRTYCTRSVTITCKKLSGNKEEQDAGKPSLRLLLGIEPRHPCQVCKWLPNAYKYGII